MGRLSFGSYGWMAAILALFTICACGGHKPAGTSPYPTKITLTPSSATSLQLGGIIQFTATATNGTSNNVSPTFTFISSDTSILNVSPRGVACAGHWDITNTICTAGGVGEVQVTASAEGQQSAPTLMFVHAPIDNIVVNGILPTNQYVQEPCLSQGQSMILQATAYSQGTDITQSVGPFSWSANNASVVTLTPTVTNFTYNIPTNEAVALAATPGMTQIFATASGVTSNTFQQPQYKNASGTLSPVLDFFETCPIQNIALEVGSGSQLTNQTSFVTTKGTSQTLTAIVTDVMGNTSLVGSDSPVILSKTPLTWISSQPAVVTVPSGCTLSCTVTTPSPGAAVITASCSPPTCNIGYPYIPPSLSSPSALAACASFFGLASCEQLIPVPVYSSPFCATQYNGTPCPPTTPPLPSAVAGLVTGATSTTSALATSTGCVGVNPIACTTSIYNVSTASAVAGSQIPLPSAPTSLLFDLGGDRAYMGSEIGALSVSPGNLGSSTSGFTTLGPVTGKILAVSNSGTFAIFSDTTLNPNQVFIVNGTTPGSPTVTAFTIEGATAAAFSPDGLKAFIYGLDTTGSPNLYVYSTVQGLQMIPLATGTAVNSIAFSTNGAFAYVVEASDPTLAGSGPGFRVYNTCQVTPGLALSSPSGTSQVIPLSATPISFQALPDGIHFIALETGGSFDYITATVIGIPAATLTSPASSLCPSFVGNTVTPLNLAQGSIQPIDFFTSPDGSLMYVLARESSSVLVYDFATGSTSAIGPLVRNALPVQAGMSADGGTIVVAGNDGYLHIVTTQLGGSDILQIPFPYLPNYLNSYCTFTPAEGPCTLNLMAVNPK